MAYTIQMGDVMQVVIQARMNNQVLLNVLHWQYEGSSPMINGEAEIDFILDTFVGEDGLIGAWKDAMNVDCKIETVTAQIIKTLRFPYKRRQTDISGTLTGQALPQNVTASITKQSTITGRGRSGKMQAFPGSVTSVSGGNLTAGWKSALFNVATVVKSRLVTTGAQDDWAPIIYDRDASGTQARVSDTLVQPTVRVMNRRTVGRGI